VIFKACKKIKEIEIRTNNQRRGNVKKFNNKLSSMSIFHKIGKSKLNFNIEAGTYYKKKN